ncbi:MAG: four helix bundle protein [Chthoniobacterales bacterium]|nr:four helix bundle protein [Chthoniobacterales bacterium]
MSEGSNFEDLEVWQRSKLLAIEICVLLRDCRDYGFRDQITRSAISVPSNISEGAERSGRAEFRQFLGYAKGSAGELRTQIIIAGELGYVTAEKSERMVTECRELSRMLWGLIRSMS